MAFNDRSHYGISRGYSQHSSSGSHTTVSSSTNNCEYNIPRTWNNDQPPLSGGGVNDPLNLRNDFLQGGDVGGLMGVGGGNLQVQVQVPTRSGPNLCKPLDMSPNDNRRLSNDSLKALTPRRGSNGSTGSVDSSYLSGAEMSNGNRRDSTHSTISYVSGGRRSATLPSPLPSRNLSPGRINQTVIEGQVLDVTHQQQEMAAGGPVTDAPVRDSNLESSNLNMLSRVSSGYGSQQTSYLAGKTSSSPTPPSRDRRSSEGASWRVSDCGFNQSLANKNQNRRFSDPVKVRNVIDNTPRRISFSYYNILPSPSTNMQSYSDEPQQQQQQQQQPTTTRATVPTTTITTITIEIQHWQPNGITTEPK